MLERLMILDTGFCRHPECTVMRGGRWSAQPFPSTVVVLVHKRLGTILFDAGYSPRFRQETSRGLAKLYGMVTPLTQTLSQPAAVQLKAMGIAPADVRLVVLSHFHADHIAGVRDFPQARFIFRDLAWDPLQGLSSVSRLLRGYLPGLLPEQFLSRSQPLVAAAKRQGVLPWSDFHDAFDLCGDGSVWAVDLPGHAAGQIGLVVPYQGETYFFVADAAWTARSIYELRPPSVLARVIMDSPRVFHQTLQRLHQFHLQQPTVHLIPCHCAESIQLLTPA